VYCTHLTEAPERDLAAGGGAAVQTGIAQAQRGANRQPGGGARGDGTLPGMPWNAVARSGWQASNAIV
jgi:hypothetical protein